ncbi:MAG: glucose 1-dehydrogenase [bacterium]|nr:glucose 1-dehydrogenase [bacterium]MCP5066600.1 glucose 1-dehydrogenase [bacterium]
MTGRLEGQVALITGGASGIGEATVRMFVSEGARVVIADIQDERGGQIAEELSEAAIFQHTNVAREDSIAAAVDLAISEFGRLDCLFANAGIIGAMGPIDEIPAEEFDATMAINLRGVFLCMKHAARVMKPQKSGTILATTSIAALQGGLGPHVYAAAKIALIGLTKNVAAELVSQGIRVNCIAPGNMATEMIAGLVTGEPDKVAEIESAIAAGSPIPGRAGQASDIAHAAVYLASDAAAFVNGHTLVVDAGLTTGSGQSMPLFANYSPMVREAGRRGLPED